MFLRREHHIVVFVAKTSRQREHYSECVSRDFQSALRTVVTLQSTKSRSIYV